MTVMLAAWHFSRAWLSSLNGNETLGNLLVGRVSKTNLDYRNAQHGLLGIVHCCGVIFLSVLLVINAWGYDLDIFLGLLKTEPEYMFDPFWPIAWSCAYFFSDLMYVFDFMIYLHHHIVSCALLFSCMVIVDIRFTGVITLLCAESGGIMLSVYVKYKTLPAHVAFCTLYALSRVAFSWFWIHLQIVSYSTPRVADDVCSALVLVLVIINWNFWYKHVLKLVTRLKQRQSAD